MFKNGDFVTIKIGEVVYHGIAGNVSNDGHFADVTNVKITDSNSVRAYPVSSEYIPNYCILDIKIDNSQS